MRKKDTATHHDDKMHSFIAEQRAKEFRREIEKARSAQTFSSAKDPIYQHLYSHTGVMVDLAHNYFSIKKLQHIIGVMSMLGFNLLHVRLVDNDFFPMELLEYAGLNMPVKENGKYYYIEGDLKALVDYASKRGVSIMPEINFSQTTPVGGSVAGLFLLSVDASLEAIGRIAPGVSINIRASAATHSDAWESQNVLGRLIAVAAGLSTSEGMDDAEFQSHCATTCSKVGFSSATIRATRLTSP